MGDQGVEEDPPCLTQLHDAIQSRDLIVVQRCLQKGVNVNEPLEENLALVLAVKHKQKDIVKALLEAGADPNLFETHKLFRNKVYTVYPLTWCAGIHDEDQEIAKLLFAANAQVNMLDKEEQTFLHNAIYYENVPYTKLLLSQGIDVFLRDYYYESTAMGSASSAGKTELVDILLLSGKYSIEEERAYKECYYGLSNAVHCGNVDIMKLFLKHGVKPDDTSYNEKTLLLQVCSALQVPENMIETIKTLHEAGANLHEVEASTGDGCFHMLASNALNAEDCTPAAGYLGWKGVDMYTKNLAGFTPLACACEGGNAEFISGMLDFGLDLHEEDPGGTGKHILQTLQTLDGRAWFRPQERIRVTVQLLVAAGNPLPPVEQLTVIEKAIVSAKDQEHAPSDSDIASAIDLIAWLKEKKQNPSTLMDLCRIRIRNQCQYCVYKCIEGFQIPSDLKKFLGLEKLILLSRGIDIDKMESEEEESEEEESEEEEPEEEEPGEEPGDAKEEEEKKEQPEESNTNHPLPSRIFFQELKKALRDTCK